MYDDPRLNQGFAPHRRGRRQTGYRFVPGERFMSVRFQPHRRRIKRDRVVGSFIIDGSGIDRVFPTREAARGYKQIHGLRGVVREKRP